MKSYTVISPVDFDNKRYEIGAAISLDDERAQALLAAGAIEPRAEKKPEKGKGE